MVDALNGVLKVSLFRPGFSFEFLSAGFPFLFSGSFDPFLFPDDHSPISLKISLNWNIGFGLRRRTLDNQ